MRLVAAAALAACWHDAPVATAPKPATKHLDAAPFTLEVAIASPRMTMATRADVRVGLRITNHTRAMMDPQIHDIELLVDGEVNIDFRAAAGNGAVDPFETALPAGQTFEKTWFLADSLFSHPGDYTLVLHEGKVASEPVHVHVDP